MSFWGDFGRYIFSYNLSFWGDFWESVLTDRKCLKCHFGEISALQYMSFSALQYMSFWGDFGVKIKNNETSGRGRSPITDLQSDQSPITNHSKSRKKFERGGGPTKLPGHVFSWNFFKVPACEDCFFRYRTLRKFFFISLTKFFQKKKYLKKWTT